MENIEFTCPKCKRAFSKKWGLTYHLKFGKHFNCLKCGKEVSGNGKFCSSACSASYNNKIRQVSESTKIKTSESLKIFYKEHPFPEKEYLQCKSCNKNISKESKTGFCGDCLKHSQNIECIEYRRAFASKAGKASAESQAEIRRSKNEIFFADLINSIYKDSLNNKSIFNGWDADIIIPSKKIAILWNGIWHYENICGQLKQVQNRDKIKYSEIVKAGYMPYIITDLGDFSKKKCLKELERFNNFIKLLSF